MKLIITENKLYNVVAKWLNNNYGDLRVSKSPGGFGFIHYKDKNKETVFLFNLNTRIVTITNKRLYHYLKDMFGLSSYELNDILTPWFKQSYHIHVDKVQYSDLH